MSNRHHGLRRLVVRSDTVSFFVLTLALSWGAWTVGYWLSSAEQVPFAFLVAGSFGPPVAGALVTWGSGGSVQSWAAQIVDWRVRPRWYAVAVLVPLASYWALLPVIALVGEPLDASVLPSRVPVYLASLVVVLIAGGGNEEPGWRGFALPRLQERYSPLTASLVIGVVWAVWHYPLFAVGQARNLTGNFPLYVVALCSISVLLTWLYNRTGGSVLLVMLFHANVNTGVLIPVSEATLADLGGVFDTAQAAVFVAFALAVLALTRGRLGVTDAPDPGHVGSPSRADSRQRARDGSADRAD